MFAYCLFFMLFFNVICKHGNCLQKKDAMLLEFMALVYYFSLYCSVFHSLQFEIHRGHNLKTLILAKVQPFGFQI